MSRTVHHIPLKHRDTSWWSPPTGPWTAHSLVELRYPSAELEESRRVGRRPVPRRVVRAFASYTYPRAHGRTPITGQDEREASARAALRLFCTRAHKELRASSLATEDLDFPPIRHRHGCIWDG
ncbi:hypothetical protein [Streptomyces sp. NBC_00829]|uniref:hypothetical protein n=1 Tax=Streptomyces sp. NBC_00829 TaxID=2903679 RepID=UPI00386B2C7A|nr:hypothetical protein OG293_27820 [Streptomyces sp. NBC_00829]